MAVFFKRLRLTAIFLLVLSLFILAVAAQSEVTQPTDVPTPTPEPDVPTPTDTPTPTDNPSPTDIPITPTSSVPVVPTSPPKPTPVFSTSDDCKACRPDYNTIDTCVQRIPKTANLTVLTQVLPFYQCICPGDLITSLQHCSTCLRSTGQLNFLIPGLYNVTNQQAKAMREVCNTTGNGREIPSGASGSRLERLMASASWGAVLTVVVVAVTLGGM
jgi:hypothetical protein